MTSVSKRAPCLYNNDNRSATTSIKAKVRSIRELQCLQIPLSDRASRRKNRDIHPECNEHCGEGSTMDQSIMIPLQVHISLSLPPTPVVPCSTPDVSARNSGVDISCNSVITEDLISTSDANCDGLDVKHVDMSSACRSVSRGRNAKKAVAGKSHNHSSALTSRNSHGVFSKSSTVTTSKGSPNQALHIKRMPQTKVVRSKQSECMELKKLIRYQEENKMKSIQVKESKNAFIMEKDGSVKKCTVYIPMSRDENDPIGVNSYDVCRGESKVLNKSKSNYTNPDRPNHYLIKKSTSFEPNLFTVKKTNKKMHRRECLSKSKMNQTSKCSSSIKVSDKLLPQNQYKKEELTFSDVLNSLNSLNEGKRGTTIESSIPSNHEMHVITTPTLSKTELRLWDEQNNPNNYAPNKLKQKRVSSAKKTPVRSPVRVSSVETKEFVQEMVPKVSEEYLRKQSPKSIETSIRKKKNFRKSTGSHSSLSKYDYRTVVLP